MNRRFRMACGSALIIALTSVAALSASPETVTFVRTDGYTKRDGSGNTDNAKFLATVTKDSHLSKEKWPFVEDAVEIFCVPRALNIVKTNGKYAALNGNTALDAKRYLIEEERVLHEILPMSNTRDAITEGLTREDASIIEINYWFEALNSRLLEKCRPSGPPSDSWGDWVR